MKLFLPILLAAALNGQEIYDLLLKNGHVIDPANGRNGRMDIAIAKGKIAKVAPGIPAAQGRRVVDLGEYYVTPGLIDIHGHFGSDGVNPDHNSLRSGVTTAVDAGSANAASFAAFQTEVAGHSKTRVLAFLDGSPEVAAKYPEIVIGLRAPATGNLPAIGTSATGLRAGDILTNIYGQSPLPLAEIRKKGVLLDSGQFWFRTAIPALKQGLLPDTISTGMNRESLLLPRATMTNVMSKFLAMGLTLDQVIARTTTAPAKAIRRPELGSLAIGGTADIAVLELRSGQFALIDSGHAKLSAAKELRCVLTVRNGVVVWDSEGLSLTHWRDAGPYSNFK